MKNTSGWLSFELPLAYPSSLYEDMVRTSLVNRASFCVKKRDYINGYDWVAWMGEMEQNREGFEGGQQRIENIMEAKESDT